jgi:PhnB protein
MHAKFKKGNLFLMMSDSFPGHEITTGNNISLVLEAQSEDEIQNLYNKLSQDGSTIMELQDTFWGAKYAKVKRPFWHRMGLELSTSIKSYSKSVPHRIDGVRFF